MWELQRRDRGECTTNSAPPLAAKASGWAREMRGAGMAASGFASPPPVPRATSALARLPPREVGGPGARDEGGGAGMPAGCFASLLVSLGLSSDLPPGGPARARTPAQTPSRLSTESARGGWGPHARTCSRTVSQRV